MNLAELEFSSLRATLIRHEGLRLKPYKCSAGFQTIGVGRNLEIRGISKQEAEYLLNNDIEGVIRELYKSVSFFSEMPKEIKEVLVNMGFNLGIAGLLKFKKFLSALQAREWTRAADEMLDSKWARQVGKRAVELAVIVRSFA